MRVCQKFFCHTLHIDKSVVLNTMKDIDSSGSYAGENKKKGKTPPNKTPEEKLKHVRSHIESFETVESHYTRANSKARYLQPGLSIAQMYRLYINDYCEAHNITNPVSHKTYRSVFLTEYNIRFFKPKKDQCITCNAFNASSDEDKLKRQVDYDSHRKRAQDAMDMKKADKDEAANDPSLRAITFDLEAVLTTPFAGDSQIYYKRKFAVYNFTIYEGHSGDGFCYMWDESEGKRGAAEIATCLLDYLKSLPESVTHVTAFCDTCAGQNRNQFLATALLYAVQKIPNLDIIDIKYMETGHSYLEADSMHSCIENARRHQKVYTTDEWALLVAGARKRPRPYTVRRLFHSDFLDVKDQTKNIVKNRTKNTDSNTVNWLKIKWLRFNKSKPYGIQYKYSVTENQFMQINVLPRRTKKPELLSNITFKRLYSRRVPISLAKKKDLMQLLKVGVIPQKYSDFYKGLPSSANAPDNLSEPSADEPEEYLEQ